MATYVGIVDDSGEDEFRVYVDTSDGSYVDISRRDEVARTRLDVNDVVAHWQIDVRDDAVPRFGQLTVDGWTSLFQAADDTSRLSPIEDRLVTYSGSQCPRVSATPSFRTCVPCR